jgi:hypothetical protein
MLLTEKRSAFRYESFWINAHHQRFRGTPGVIERKHEMMLHVLLAFLWVHCSIVSITCNVAQEGQNVP